jgi:hypothetical protein
MSKNINKLGERIDGWADLVVNAGDEAELARKQLEVIIQRKSFPGTLVSSELITPSTGGKMRSYIIAEMNNGATVAAYFGSFGKDLYAKWDIYRKNIINEPVLYSCLAFSGLLGLLVGNWFNNIFGGFGLGGFIAFLIGFLLGSIPFFIIQLISLVFIGIIIKQSGFGFIFKEMDEFDIDDMGALTLAVHKAMLDTLDAIGIETQALRMKEKFSVGKRERLI